MAEHPGRGQARAGCAGGRHPPRAAGRGRGRRALVIPCVKSATVLVFTCATVIAILDIQAF